MRTLLILLAIPVWAQTQWPPSPIFPSDGTDPKTSGGAELLEGVCPGRVAVGKEIRCRITCPRFTHPVLDDDSWSVTRITRGHFISPSSEDAVLWMSGCELHDYSFGGSILLTRRSGSWRMMWYRAGLNTDVCHRAVLSSGREDLVCIEQVAGQGETWTTVHLHDLRSPPEEPDPRGLLRVDDNYITCGENYESPTKPNPLSRAYIERVIFGKNSAMTVLAHYGKHATTPDEVQRCLANFSKHVTERPSYFPETKLYRINFLFDGHTYKPAPGSEKAAAQFQPQ